MSPQNLGDKFRGLQKARGPAQARPARARLWAGRAAGLKLGPARPVGPPI